MPVRAPAFARLAATTRTTKGSTTMHNRMMITGAGSGLGREIALRWAREGWQLALSDVNEGGLAETLKMVREAGGDGFTMRCDVRDYSQLIAFAQACEEKLGGIDIVVNNAGVASGRSEEHTSELQSLMRISYAVFCLKKNKKNN